MKTVYVVLNAEVASYDSICGVYSDKKEAIKHGLAIAQLDLNSYEDYMNEGCIHISSDKGIAFIETIQVIEKFDE